MAELSTEMNVGVTPEHGEAPKGESSIPDKRPWQVAGKKKRNPIRVKGTREAGAEKIKTVPRTEILATYVGCLHPETTEEELSSYLTEEGIKGVVCKKLLSKGGKVLPSSTFYVTCCIECKDLFYSEGSWPEGVELCDWVYYNE